MSDASLWIFGYGSLVWRPAFAHLRVMPAAIEGWTRRFWQGSTDHRGVPAKPGRVVTLLRNQDPDILAELENEIDRSTRHARHPKAPTPTACWGVAYEVEAADRSDVLARLDHRERGGYERVEVDITLEPNSTQRHTISGLMYVASTRNPNYLGAASVDVIASQIDGATGPSGANPEYVYELAARLRSIGAEDAHVFAVESALERLSKERAS